MRLRGSREQLMPALGLGKIDPSTGKKHDKNYDEADAEPVHKRHFFRI